MMKTNTQHTEQANRPIEPASLIERTALASISDGVVISDTAGLVIMLNRAAARILQANPETVLGQPVRTLFEPFSARGRLITVDAMDRLCADPYSYGESGESAETIIEIGPRFIQAHLSPMLTDVGEFLGVVTVLRDITREVETDRARSDFVSNVSHELRLPLTAIKGYCDLLLHDTVEQFDEEQGHFLRIIQSNADHLVALIKDLLDISRIESYRLNLDIQPVLMETIIRDVADRIRPQCDQKGLQLTVETDANVGMVLGDENRLRQVVANLANNACHNTPEGGHVTLALSCSDNQVRVDVTDTGTSISPEDQARIFERFHRIQGPVAHEVNGTGLALPVAKMLIEMHGGRLWLQSEPGRGNTLTFVLPQRVQVPDDGAGEALGQPEQAHTVLVIEDDEDIAQLIALQLRREGFEVLTTAYGEEAVSLVQTQHVDLITLDMMLPDITGMEVLHRIKTNPETAGIPVIIVSVLLPEQTGDAERGAVDYITKPFAFEKLMESIRRTLATPQRERPVSARAAR
jgi:signal transduction histidine kinase/ActR/RegA family two-component response regulator